MVNAVTRSLRAIGKRLTFTFELREKWSAEKEEIGTILSMEYIPSSESPSGLDSVGIGSTWNHEKYSMIIQGEKEKYEVENKEWLEIAQGQKKVRVKYVEVITENWDYQPPHYEAKQLIHSYSNSPRRKVTGIEKLVSEFNK